MARKIINNKYQGETGLSSRTKINDNFEELYSNIVPKVFDTIEDLTDYALNNPTACAGQQCVVKGNPSSVYVINENKTITLIATSSNINSLVNVDLSAVNTAISDLQNQLSYKADLINKKLSETQIPNNILLSDGSIPLAINGVDLGAPIEVTLDFIIINKDYTSILEQDLSILLRILINTNPLEYEIVEKTIKSFELIDSYTKILLNEPFDEFKKVENVSLKGDIYIPLTEDSIITKRYIANKADLDENGKVVSSQLPSYIDEVIEYVNYAALPIIGTSGKIYVTLDNNKTYRWGSSYYVEISSSLSLGETSSSAYRGDYGKSAYDHSRLQHAPSNAQKNSDITPEEIAAKLPSNILLNDGSTQMTVTLTYTPIGTVYEAEGDFSTINVNSGKICFNWDVRSSISVGDYLKLYSSTLTDIYYVQINQIDYISEYFVILNYLNIPNFKSNVINRAVKVIRNEVSYTPVEDLDLATKEYVDTKSATYTNSTPVQQALGGISVGETFENISVVKMFDKLLYPYQSPAFSSFGLSNGRTILECGENWNGVTNASFTFTNVSNVKADSLAIYQDATTLVSAQPITSPIAVTLIQANKSVDGQFITMKVEAKNTNNILFNRSYNVTWYMPYYFGVGTVGLDVATIKLLTKTVTSKANITKTYSTTNQVPYLAYPISRGLLTSILDKNGYETISDFTRTERTFIINGISVQYYVYEFNNPSTANNLQITYKY